MFNTTMPDPWRSSEDGGERSMSPQSSKGASGEQNTATPTVKVFYSYADEDISELRQLEQQLSSLRNKKTIEEFHRGMLQPGEDEEQVVKAQVKQAKIILLLISPKFLEERFNSAEVQEIITHYLKPDATGLPRVIPILLRHSVLDDEAWLTHLVPIPPK